MATLEKLKQRAAALKGEMVALYLAAQHRRTPWYAKLLIAMIASYALSPIDLIPDFIPVLGLLDDLVLLPLGVTLVLKLVPAEVMQECRSRASMPLPKRTTAGTLAAAIIVLLWLSVAVAGGVWGWLALRAS